MSDSRRSSTSTASKSSGPIPERTQNAERQITRNRNRRSSPMAHTPGTRYPVLPSLKPSTRRLQVEMCFPELDSSKAKTLKPIIREQPNEKLVFLAGGVSPIADWRAKLMSHLTVSAAARGQEFPNVVLISPYFKAKALNMSDQLTKWEIDHIPKCDLVIFWFHKYSPCTISLLELGQWAVPQALRPQGRYKVLVGADTEYEQQRAVTSYCEGKHKVYDSLDALAEAAADVLRATS